MSERGMKKWAPYKSLVEQEKYLKKAHDDNQKVDKVLRLVLWGSASVAAMRPVPASRASPVDILMWCVPRSRLMALT